MAKIWGYPARTLPGDARSMLAVRHCPPGRRPASTSILPTARNTPTKEAIMGKSHDERKKPLKSLKEKRRDKKAKKGTRE